MPPHDTSPTPAPSAGGPEERPQNASRRTRRVRSAAASRRPIAPPPAPTPTVLRTLYQELLTLPNVEGCMIGRKIRRGRRTAELAVVCCVREKVRPGALARHARIPPTLRWGGVGGVRCELPTDVLALGPHARQSSPAAVASGASAETATLGPGDVVLGSVGPGGTPLGGTGTVGVVMRHPVYGTVVTTAGHVVGQSTPGVITYPDGAQPTVLLQNAGGNTGAGTARGRALKASVTAEADYALVAPELGEQSANVWHDQYALGRLYIPDPSDVGATLYVLSAADARRTTMRYVDAAAPVGATALSHALLTDFATAGGDSGACLVDANARVWGLLVGFTTLGGEQYSVFTPAYIPFLLEAAHLY